MRADLHLHSRFSDGSDSAETLARVITDGGFGVVALTDHDTDEGNEALRALLPDGIRLISGIEFTCIMPRGKCHILGYGFDADAPAFREAIEEGKQRRRQKLERRLEFLRETHSIVFDETELASLYALPTVGKPHIAALLVARGMASDIADAIEKYMSQGKIHAADRLDADYAIKAILSAGGIPVWAHPLGGEGEEHLGKDELLSRLAYLKEAGIRGLECYYSRYTGEESAMLLSVAEAEGLLVSGGSDYHGKIKNIPIGTLSADGESVSAEQLTVLNFL